jgi:hypothetical protein
MEQTLPRRRALIAVALGLLAAAAPCQARSFGLPSAEKNAAIIGGPSQLAAIMAAQSTGAAFAVPAAYPATFAVRRPIFYAAPMPRAENFDASPTRPDIFYSVAMPIATTALDARW